MEFFNKYNIYIKPSDEDLIEVLYNDPRGYNFILSTNENESCYFRCKEGVSHDTFLLLILDLYAGFDIYTINNETNKKYDGSSKDFKDLSNVDYKDLKINLETFRKIFDAFERMSGEYGDTLLALKCVTIKGKNHCIISHDKFQSLFSEYISLKLLQNP